MPNGRSESPERYGLRVARVSWFNRSGNRAMQPARTKRPAPPPDEELQFHRLVRQSVEPGILLLAEDGRLVSLNAVALGLFGPEASGWVGGATELLPAPLPAVLREALMAGTSVQDRTITLEDTGQDPQRKVVWLNTFLIRNDAGTPGYLVVTLHDLGMARELERFTTRLQQLANVGLLSAGVAHEVKNAMVAVKTYAELLLETQPESEEATLVRQEVSRIDSLIGQLLQLSAPPQPLPAPVNLHEVLSHALRLVHHRLREQAIEPVVLLEAAEDRVLGNAKQLEQAFLNLLINAAEAMDQAGRLVVRTEVVVATEHISKFEPGRPRQQIQVEVRDSGSGMAPELIDRLFTPFVTTKPGGTGLGLAVTRRIVHEHRGRISVESKPGEGTVFRVLLPLLKAGAPGK
jgi:signal transduction histidine kinase